MALPHRIVCIIAALLCFTKSLRWHAPRLLVALAPSLMPILSATTTGLPSAPRVTTWGAVDVRRRGAVRNRLTADAAGWVRPKRPSNGTRQPARAPRGSHQLVRRGRALQRPPACCSGRVPASVGGATRWHAPLPVGRCRGGSSARLAGRALRTSPPSCQRSVCHTCP